MTRTQESESAILKTIMEGLAAKRIWAVRMNSGAMFGSYKGRKWAVRFGRKGMADILAMPYMNCDPPRCSRRFIWPLWIEVKRPGEKQSEAQRVFACEVMGEGHQYIVAHSWEELEPRLAVYSECVVR